MDLRVITRITSCSIAIAVLAVVMPGESTATNIFPVDAGYDLLQTVPGGTTFNGVNYEGVQLGTFDFGGGQVGVGNADTIIQRTQTVNSVGGTTNLSVRALQLESVTPVSGHTLFVTLDQAAQTAWESVSTNNVMTINATTFSTTNFDVFFDVHLDSLNGTIVNSGSIDLSVASTDWTNNAPPGAVLLDGINHNLNGSNENNDFWPGNGGDLIQHNGPHEVIPATPEPSTLAMAVSGVIVLFYRWRKRTTEPV